MNLKTINQIAYAQMADKSNNGWKEKGNKYYHGQRVALLTITLRKELFPDDSSHDEILTIAAWFHDIKNCDGVSIPEHAAEGAKAAKIILGDFCTQDELKKICDIIAVHDDRCCDRKLLSDYVKLHQDADHLDHFGTYDVWRSFLSAKSNNQTIIDVIKDMTDNRHFHEEFKRFRAELNYDLSRAIFEEKMQFYKQFSERFNVECTGGIWNKELINRKQ